MPSDRPISASTRLSVSSSRASSRSRAVHVSTPMSRSVAEPSTPSTPAYFADYHPSAEAADRSGTIATAGSPPTIRTTAADKNTVVLTP
jgi:hypothetical protein